MLVLRSDLAAIGAYAFGAAGGSIGINPTARHYVPPGEKGWADNSDPTPRVLVGGILEWWKGSRIGLQGEDPLFDCQPCPVCDGRSLARFQDEALEVEAARHNAAAWLAIAEKLVDTPANKRADVWIGLCEQADDYLTEMEDRDGILHPPSRQLKSWLEFSRVSAP